MNGSGGLLGIGAQMVSSVGELLPRLAWSAETLLAHRRQALAATIANAQEQSRWHAARLRDVDPAGLDPDELNALPVMTKSELMGSWDQIVTDPRLSLAAARAHLQQVDAAGLALLLDEYLVFQTGGSTGEPGVFCWRADEMARWGASAIRWSIAAGVAPPERQAWVGARSPRHPSAAVNALRGAAAELTIPVDQPLHRIVDQLNALQPDAVSVVASMLGALADAAHRGDLTISPAQISIFGDMASPHAVAAATKVFGVAPTESYPTTDVGHLGQQSPGEPGIYLNDDLLIIECVDEREQPVPAGVLCDHLLVTSLHQHTLPLIRYRIDDRVIVEPQPGRHPAFRRLACIDGRSDDSFRYPEATVHPHAVRSALGRHLDVRDYQVRQVARGIDVSIVASDDVAVAQLTDDLDAALRAAGLGEPEVSVRRVDALEQTSMGKRRHFLPLPAG